MSGPPDWGDTPDANPNDYGPGVAAKRGGGGNYQSNRRPKIDPAEVPALAAEFYAWLHDRDTHAQLKAVLPDHIDLGVFIETAKAAVLNKPELLRDDFRPSLLLAVSQAAGMGLLPNGKQGALLVRWDRESGERVVWQVMVWGLVKLGRETGAIKNIRTVIVFRGEHVEVDEVANTIAHRRGPEELMIVEEAYGSMIGGKTDKGQQIYLPDQFLDRITMAYCIITAADGAQIMRWMTGARIKMVRNSSPAKWGPWAGAFMDEMVAKTIMLWTTKLIDLDTTSAPARRFQAALEADMHIDFDRDGAPVPRVAQEPGQPAPRALAAPGMKLDILGDAISRTKVPVERETREEPFQDAPRGEAETTGTDTPPAGAEPPGDKPRRKIGEVLADLGTKLADAKTRDDVIAIIESEEAAKVTGFVTGLAMERWTAMTKAALARTEPFPGDTPIEDAP